MLGFRWIIAIVISIGLLKTGYSETIPSIQVANFKSDFAYLINWSGNTVVGEDYETACGLLDGCYWGVIPSKSEYPACYSPSLNTMIIGTTTWYCANGDLSYYNVPANYCNTLSVCPNATWTLTSNGQNCTRPNPNCSETSQTVSEFQLLAAIVYGEASLNSPYEEKAGIANAVIRKRNALQYSSVNQLVLKKPYFSAAVLNQNERFRIAMCANIEVEYHGLYQAVTNALDPNGTDYANGACFWDGNDLKTLGSKHIHYKQGYTITDPSHNVLSVTPPPPRNATGPFGSYDYVYESTAGYGKTIFWKYTQGFISANGATQCK